MSVQQDALAPKYGMIKFILIAAIVFCALYISYYNWFTSQQIFGGYLEFCAALSSKILNSLGAEQSTLFHLTNGLVAEIQSHDGAFIRVTNGAEGGLVAIMLTAAIIAWPGSRLKKLATVCGGLIMIFALSIVRICLLFKTDVYQAHLFDLMNIWILPGVLLVLVSFYFISWIKWSGTHPMRSA